MRIESTFMISYLKCISSNALPIRIKNKLSREVLLCGLMRINMSVPRACDTAGKKMARGAGWSNEATHALISLWGKANVQEKLDGVSRNRLIYEGIAEGMRKVGYDYSWKQCRTNLTQKYCKVSF